MRSCVDASPASGCPSVRKRWVDSDRGLLREGVAALVCNAVPRTEIVMARPHTATEWHLAMLRLAVFHRGEKTREGRTYFANSGNDSATRASFRNWFGLGSL